MLESAQPLASPDCSSPSSSLPVSTGQDPCTHAVHASTAAYLAMSCDKEGESHVDLFVT